MDYTKVNWNAAVQNTMADYEKNKANNTFEKKETDLTKYFSVALPDGVNAGEKILRLLPISADRPFEYFTTGRFHNLQIGKKWVKLYDPAQDGEESPLNDMYKIYMEGDKDDRKIANNYKSRDFYIVRGIERGKEEEGVKFWRFPSGDNCIIPKLTPLMTHLEKKSPGAGAIWRPDALGRDIVITIVRDTVKKFSKVSQIITDDPSPLCVDQELADKWINDPLTWKDIYKKKSIDYLRIVAEGSEPVWDSEKGGFVAKVEGQEAQYRTAPPISGGSYPEPTTLSAPSSTPTEPKVDITVDDLPF